MLVGICFCCFYYTQRTWTLHSLHLFSIKMTPIASQNLSGRNSVEHFSMHGRRSCAFTFVFVLRTFLWSSRRELFLALATTPSQNPSTEETPLPSGKANTPDSLSTMTTTTPSGSSDKTKKIDPTDAFQGSRKVSPIIPISGAILGNLSPFVFYTLWTSKMKASSHDDTVENVLLVLQSMVCPALLFVSEFVWGGITRNECPKSAIAPAAAQAAGIVPFAIVECNRIHQNHIESACIYIPSCLSAAAAGVPAQFLVATTCSWVLCRCVYRWGYRHHANPLWRLVGTVSSLTQSFFCLGLFVHAKYSTWK
jgi:uncharacterized MAPEG superfamily protein